MSTETPNLIEEIRELLHGGVSEVFNTMLALEVCPAPLQDLAPEGEVLVVGSVGFVGDVNGIVYLHVADSLARKLTSYMLGLPEEEIDGDEMVNDAIGELCNMIVGAAKSQLCDTGSACVLTIPSIVRGRDFNIEQAGSDDRRLLGFRCGDAHLLVELVMRRPATEQ